MSGKDQNTPAVKPGGRNRKAGHRSQKAARAQSPKPDQPQPAGEQVGTSEQIDMTTAQAEAAPVEAPASPDTVPVSFRTLADAYGDYTRKSFEETRSFVEKLNGVRSLDKAMEVQTEFARQAYQTFVAESQRIRKLHAELAMQTLKPLQRKVPKASRDPH